MRQEQVRSDITVVGGGLSGVCAAIAAARLGRSVALVQNRPVLGGNSSSEVRVWVSGATATGVNRYARETGIIGELMVENQYRNPEGNPYIWDALILEAVRQEPNIRLFLNTDVIEVDSDGPEADRRITAVTGWMTGSERHIRFESPYFLDCTGDGLIGFLAGARYRIGREARSEYGEPWAPEEADAITLGTTMFFYTKEADRPVRYVPPAFAKNIADTSIPIKRVIRSGDSGCHYWWIEWGGEVDTIHDNERIRDELWFVIYGIWDYIKNSGQFDAERLTLEWVGSVPGKRESRRFLGDYVLTQHDIIAQTPFEDRVAFGGWSIDLHPPEGMYAQTGGSKHMHADGIYHIPYRSLYSANVGNLLFAGRNISASHIAFGTTRVMATCAAMGEAAGTAAALCAGTGTTPSELGRWHLRTLQQTLLRQDAAVIGVRNADEGDVARQASVDASCWRRRLETDPAASEPYLLDNDVALLLPVDPALGPIELWLAADAPTSTRVTVEVWDTGRAENYVPAVRRAEAEAEVEPGEPRWVRFETEWRPAEPQNAFVIIRANPAVTAYLASQPLSGVLAFARRAPADVPSLLEEREANQPVIEWSMKPLVRRPFVFRCGDETAAYRPEKATNGYARPYGGPNMWLSEAFTGTGTAGAAADPDREPWLRLRWPQPVALGEIALTFNDDVNEYLINLHFLRTPFEIMPELVKDYRIESWNGAEWQPIVRVRDNRKRRRVHRFAEPLTTTEMRIVIEATNGSRQAEIVEIRAYEHPSRAEKGME